MNNIGERIKQRRKELEYSQTKLSRKAGVSQTEISRVESGGNLGIVTTEKILNAMGVHLAFMFDTEFKK